MLISRFLRTIISDDAGRQVKACNQFRFPSVTFDSTKQICYLPSTHLIDIPVFADTKLTVAQTDLLFIELLRSCKHSTAVDVLIDDPEHWRDVFNSLVMSLFETLESNVTKIAILGNGLERFQTLFQAMLKDFKFIELFEHPALRTDIIVLPLDMPCGYLVKLGKRRQKTGLAVFEKCVKRLSFHTDDQLKQWLQLCTAQIEKEADGNI